MSSDEGGAMTAVARRESSLDTTEEKPIDGHKARGLRGLFFLLGTRRTTLTLAAVTSTLGVALALVPFVCVAKMADHIFATPARLDEVRTLAFVALGAVLLRCLFTAASGVLAHVAAFRILHDLRVAIARKLGGVPLSFFARRSTGELKRTMMDDVNAIEAFVAHHFPDAVSSVSVPIVTAGILFAVDWRMALASVVMGPVAVGVMALSMRDGPELHRQWFELQERTNASMLEYLRGIHVIKTFGLTARSFGDLSRSIEDGLAWLDRFMKESGKGYGAFGAIIGSSVVILMPLGGWLYLTDAISLPDLVLFLVLGPQLLTSMLRLMFAWGNVQRIEQSTSRIADILLSPDLDRKEAYIVPTDATISFRDVSFRYADDDRAEALSHVTFEARAGEMTALVGPSGAGKTTVARLIPRLWEATRGRVELGGVDVKDIPLDVLLSRVSVVFQDVFLFHGTVRENLLMAKPDATDEELTRACRSAQAHDFIMALPNGYDTLVGERAARLSGGERQRLSIARALLKDAPVLVLDEATAFADAQNEALIQDALDELCRGRTVIVIAHRLSTITCAHRIVVMDAGTVVDQGTHEELAGRCALYKRLWHDHDAALGWELGDDAREGGDASLDEVTRREPRDGAAGETAVDVGAWEMPK